MTRSENFSSSASHLKRALCSWWCDAQQVEVTDEGLRVWLAIDWPDGDRVAIRVTPPLEGRSGVVSDWGAVASGLFLHGIHDHTRLRAYAASLGLHADRHGVFERRIASLDEAPLAISAFTQLVAVANAELASVRFQPPGMVVPATWANLLSTELGEKRGARVISDGDDAVGLVHRVSRHTTVAFDHGQPLLVSPYLRADKGTAWYTGLFYLLNQASPSIRAVVPLIRSESPRVEHAELSELERVAASRGRVLEFVTTAPKESRFDSDAGDYPAMEKLRSAAAHVGQVFDHVRRAA